MRIAGIVPESIVDGPGMRYVIFVQGCPHACPGCHNPATHDPNGGIERSADDIAAELRAAAADDPLLDGVTFSGGEPMAQARELLTVAAAVKDAGLSLWVYTGWTIDEIRERNDEHELALVRAADVLVDGKFVAAERTLEQRFVGSRNQRVIKSPGSLL